MLQKLPSQQPLCPVQHKNTDNHGIDEEFSYNPLASLQVTHSWKTSFPQNVTKYLVPSSQQFKIIDSTNFIYMFSACQSQNLKGYSNLDPPKVPQKAIPLYILKFIYN
jgi:hypothetical protein